MEETLPTIDIKKFNTLFPHYVDAQLGDDFFIADFDLNEKDSIIEYPCRVDGYVIIYCLDGYLDVDINLNSFKLEKYSLVISVPGNIIRLANHTAMPVHFCVVASSKELFSSINVDFKKLFNESMTLLSNPCLQLEEDEVKLLGRFMSTACEIMPMDFKNKKDILGSMITSVSYLISSIWTKHLDSVSSISNTKSNRANYILNEFLKLVAEYHNTERNVTFYADKLCLTPKYLSKLIKTVSGISAPDWINSYVILEAKNMLKFSDLTISEIVYKLNFTSQSVFYKFFKGHTGITPSEYRKS